MIYCFDLDGTLVTEHMTKGTDSTSLYDGMTKLFRYELKCVLLEFLMGSRFSYLV